MKKRNIALVLSAFVFAATTVLVGCSKDSVNKENTSSVPESSAENPSSVEDEAQPDPLAPADESSEQESNSEGSEKITDGSESDSQSESSDSSNSGDQTSENESKTLLEKAQELFETACKTSWDFHVGCPYTLDYNTYIENEFGWQFFLITDGTISSLADVEADYFKVFSSSYGSDLSEIFIERDGKVYALDGERGADIYYKGSKVTAVKEQSDSEIFFTVENYYSGDDFTGERDITETAEFSAVIEADGTWRAGQFILPY